MAGKKINRNHGHCKYTADIDAEICERIGNGEPLAQICREDHMPSLSTVYNWEADDAEFAARVARARLAGYDQIAQEALTIADTQCPGVTVKMEPDEGGELVVVEQRREDMLGHRKLQVDTRLKLLACWDPRRYGARQEVTHAGGITFATKEQKDAAVAAALSSDVVKKIHSE